MIRLVKNSDIEQLLNLYNKCTLFLNENDMNHWDDYWNKENISKTIALNNLYIFLVEDKIVAAISTSLTKPKQYNLKDYESKSMYLSGLAVLPKDHKRGYALKLIRFVEEEATKQGFKALCFDARSDYVDLINFYRKLDCVDLGKIKGKRFNYTIMSKKLCN